MLLANMAHLIVLCFESAFILWPQSKLFGYAVIQDLMLDNFKMMYYLFADLIVISNLYLQGIEKCARNISPPNLSRVLESKFSSKSKAGNEMLSMI